MLELATYPNMTTTGNGVKTVMVKIATLIPYPRNPRKNDPAVERMVASIREFGFKIPILIQSNGTVIDGHLRLKAAQQVGMEEVPAILCDEWSAAQVKAFRLLANRSVNWADWDDELVALEIADLEDMGFDLSLTGFDRDEIEEFQLAGLDGWTDEDAIAEPHLMHGNGPGRYHPAASQLAIETFVDRMQHFNCIACL